MRTRSGKLPPMSPLQDLAISHPLKFQGLLSRFGAWAEELTAGGSSLMAGRSCSRKRQPARNVCELGCSLNSKRAMQCHANNRFWIGNISLSWLIWHSNPFNTIPSNIYIQTKPQIKGFLSILRSSSLFVNLSRILIPIPVLKIHLCQPQSHRFWI
jgi:hypothetical protein